MLGAEVITAIGASFVAPTIAYLKIQESRRNTANNRDVKHSLLEQRIAQVETKISEIDDIRETVAEIRLIVTRLETILMFFQKHMDKEDQK